MTIDRGAISHGTIDRGAISHGISYGWSSDRHLDLFSERTSLMSRQENFSRFSARFLVCAVIGGTLALCGHADGLTVTYD